MPDLKTWDWKGFVRTVAPTLGTALGGPLAGAAIAAISNAVLGRAGTEGEVADIISNGQLTPEQIVAIKQADYAFQTKMAEVGVNLREIEFKTEELYISDVKSARERQIATRDYMPQIIFFLMLTAEVSLMLVFIYGSMPAEEYTRALITTAFGAVNSGFVGAIAYFIGSSRGSAKSGDAMRRIAEAAPPAVQQQQPASVVQVNNPAA